MPHLVREKRRDAVTSIRVNAITVQPDRYKPTSLDPVELEHLRAKRAKVRFTVSEGRRTSEFAAILEFRGRTLIVSRKSGSFSASELADWLAMEYENRYGIEGLLILDEDEEEDEEECEGTVRGPQDFLDFLHLVKVRGIEFTTTAG